MPHLINTALENHKYNKGHYANWQLDDFYSNKLQCKAITFTHTYVENSKDHYSQLHESWFYDCVFGRSLFEGTSLKRVFFDRAYFRDCDFHIVGISDCVFSRCSFSKLSFHKSVLRDCTFVNCTFDEVFFIDTQVFTNKFFGCHFDRDTQIPDLTSNNVVLDNNPDD